MTLQCSNRVKKIQSSPIRNLNGLADECRKRGVYIYPINIGQPDIETPSIYFDAIKNYDKNIVEYTNSQGTDILLESFIKYYDNININLTKENISITNGGSEALLFSFIITCEHNDEIIIPEPYYTNYNSIGELAGINIIPVPSTIEDGYRLPSKKSIIDKITDKTKAILLCNPCNPTGVVYNIDEINILLDIAIEKDLFIICDEVYREFVYDNINFTSILSLNKAKEKIILIDSISKRYSACGARIGTFVSYNKDVVREAVKLCQTRLSSPVLEQIGASELSNTPRDYLIKVNKEYEKRRNILIEELSKIKNIKFTKPEGAFYVMVKLPVKSSEDFSKWLLTDYSYNKKETILVAPASGFYNTEGLGYDEIRLSYCLNTKDLKKACAILNDALNEYIN